MSEARDLIAVYADESCLGNGREGDNPGGAGALVEYRTAQGVLVRRDLWISEPGTTNNRMALRSVSETLVAIGARGARFRVVLDRKSTRLNSSHTDISRMPSSA